jgi:hypothetical protein
MRETSDYLNKQLPKGNKLVILNIQSEFPALSEYIIDELIANTVNDRVFSVVDRQQLNTIRAELDFQMSGEVDDDTAQALGRMAGAQIIISGAVSRIGDLYRLRVRALSVQSAQIAGQFNRNIPDSPVVAALVKSKGSAKPKATAETTGNNAGKDSSTPTQGGATALTVPVQSPALAPAPKTYKIGDTGPAGGIIFHDKKVFSNGWRYLEAMPAEMEFTAQWGAKGQDVKTETAVGMGKRNTQLIIETLKRMKQNDRAAEICASLEFGGYKDWFLPSKDELYLMYTNLKQQDMGSFGRGWYWSSSNSGSFDRTTWAQRFSDGLQNGSGGFGGSGHKSNTYSVRAIRAF